MSAMDGNELQRRLMLEQVADAAVTKFRLENPELFAERKKESEIPAPLKWAGGILGSAFAAIGAAAFIWGISSISSMQVTLARVEERIAGMDRTQQDRLDRVEVRVAAIEESRRGERK